MYKIYNPQVVQCLLTVCDHALYKSMNKIHCMYIFKKTLYNNVASFCVFFYAEYCHLTINIIEFAGFLLLKHKYMYMTVERE